VWGGEAHNVPGPALRLGHAKAWACASLKLEPSSSKAETAIGSRNIKLPYIDQIPAEVIQPGIWKKSQNTRVSQMKTLKT
jgi:hypothetical protein